MIKITEFKYKPSEHEEEKASNSYLLSLFTLAAGMPLPILNLISAFYFLVANKRSSYYVRWHCMQSLLAELLLFFINSVMITWIVFLLLGKVMINDYFIAFMIIAVLLNVIIFIITIISATVTRKGKHIEWFFFAPLTDLTMGEYTETDIRKPENIFPPKKRFEL